MPQKLSKIIILVKCLFGLAVKRNFAIYPFQNKAAVLSTYILCGFGSIAALGINLGSLTSAAPEMRPKFAKLLLRAMINGNIACFMTACVAGTFVIILLTIKSLFLEGQNIKTEFQEKDMKIEFSSPCFICTVTISMLF